MTEKSIAKTLTVLFHPILYPIYGFLLLVFFDSHLVVKIDYQVKLYVLGVVFFNTLVLPLLLMWLFKKRGFISSLKLKNRSERFYPLFIGLLFYISSWYLINILQLPPLYTYILILSIVLSILAIGINFFYKISLHSMGSAAFSSALLSFSILYNIQITTAIVSVFLLTGLISSSRLILNAHRPSQVYAGLIVGVFASLICLVFIN